MDCLTENTFQELLDGTLGAARRRDTQVHLDTCRSCRELLSTLALGLSTTSGPGPEEAGSLSAAGSGSAMPSAMAPGTGVGRFIVQAPLGAGGMGVVYAADDPVLGRKVALKLIHADHSEGPASEEWRARLLREARAIARLSHPNVITVHEIGLHGDQPFVAMELVEGSTLRSWLAASPRSWRDIVSVFVAAGRGLAAAHRAGLVHRDFKPDNVLIGHDGQIRVTDFGLARPLPGTDRHGPDDPATEEPGEALGALGSCVEDRQGRLTRTGALVGTPGYMAPEVLCGGAADVASDQFSFCVTLHEALFGGRPLLRASPEPGVEPSGPETGVERKPAARVRNDRHAVPGWLQRAVQRGLCESPEGRYPSMDDLLHALLHEPVQLRGRVLIAIAAAALAGAGIAIHLLDGRPAFALCAGAESQLASIWNPGARAEIGAAFAATRLAYAPDVWGRVAPLLDSYAEQWTEMHTEACRATRVRGEQSELLMDRRMACLDVRRRELDQLTRLLLRPDAAVVEHAVQAARGLSAIQGCGDLAALVRPNTLPSDPVIAARVRALREQLAEVHVLHGAGKYADGLALVTRLAAEPIATEYLPLRAEVAYLTGQLHASRTEWEPALARLQDAIWAAEASGHDEIAVAALGGAIPVLADLDRFKETDGMIRRGEAALLRTASAPLQRAEFRTSVCRALATQGQYSEAREQCRQALDLRRSELGPEHPAVATSLFFLAQYAGRTAGAPSNDEALGYLREALAIREKALGPEHPELSSTLDAMSDTERRLGRLDDALAHAQRALVIAERALGPDSMRMYSALMSLGRVLHKLRRDAEAEAPLRRVLAIAEHAVGPEHSQTAAAHLAVGEVLQAQTHYAIALKHFQRAEAISAATVGTGHLRYAIAVLNICSMHLELKRPRLALPACTRGLAALERAVGPDARDVADALVGIVDRVYAANGMIREALAALERGIAIWPKGDPTASARIAEGEFTLAQTMWEYARSHRASARTLATRAHDRLHDAGPEHAARRDDVTVWLATHR